MLVLCGMPGCGKDTVLKILVEKYGMDQIVRYTTRPIRPGEENGKTYHYTNNKTFEKMREAGVLAEHETFHVADDNNPWYYGSVIGDFSDNRVMITSPDGIRMLKENPEIENLYIVQLYVPEDELRPRLANRPWSEAELERRLESDQERYRSIKMLIDAVVPAYSSAFPPEKVAEQIYRYYTRELSLKKPQKKEGIVLKVKDLNPGDVFIHDGRIKVAIDTPNDEGIFGVTREEYYLDEEKRKTYIYGYTNACTIQIDPELEVEVLRNLENPEKIQATTFSL